MSAYPILTLLALLAITELTLLLAGQIEAAAVLFLSAPLAALAALILSAAATHLICRRRHTPPKRLKGATP